MRFAYPTATRDETTTSNPLRTTERMTSTPTQITTARYTGERTFMFVLFDLFCVGICVDWTGMIYKEQTFEKNTRFLFKLLEISYDAFV